MAQLLKYLILFCLLVTFSLAAQQSLVMRISLKLSMPPSMMQLNTEVTYTLNQWLSLGEVGTNLNNGAAITKMPLGVASKVPCKQRSLILWRLFKNKSGSLINELLLLRHCKVAMDINWRQAAQLNRSVHIKTKQLEVTTTLTRPKVSTKPSGRFIL